MPSRLMAALCVFLLAASARADQPTGAAIFKAQCAFCHGPAGEGTKRYQDVLMGDKSIAQLAKVVRDTMPESDPGSLTDDEAAAVAAFMYDAFYSIEAQERNAPPRIELARLTVEQYRLTVSDLVGSFRAPVQLNAERGLRGEYFAGRAFRDDRRKLDRVDPQLAFDFGPDSPSQDIEAADFSARWTGAIIPPETGEYEFILRTDHGARLFVSDSRKALIDAWVKSGTDSEFRGSVSLTAGRPTYVRVEFTKAKQGVNDRKKSKTPVPAFVRLEWKPPHRPAAVVPTQNLAPVRGAETFTVTTPFPPDDKSRGWVRGTTLSKAWDQAATDAALETAAFIATELNTLAGLAEIQEAPMAGDDPGGEDLDRHRKPTVAETERLEKARQFTRNFVERAFRRPLTDEEAGQFVDRHFPPHTDPVEAVRKAVALALLSPRFLYREVGVDPINPHAVAARLSYTLWDSAPDLELTKAANKGHLKTPDQVRAQATRMAADLKAQVKLQGFLRQWLRLDGHAEPTKSKERFPDFTPTHADDLRTSLELFTNDVLTSPNADFRQLLLADEVYVNADLAKLYAVNGPETGFRKTKLSGERAGVLTHPYLLTALAYTAETSPIHRGVFVARGILGVTLKPPSEAFTPLSPDLHPALNTRERVLLQTNGANCQSCHAVINPLGFALEQFDAIGRLRDADNNRPVDTRGEYLNREGKTVQFRGARELAKYLAASPEVHDAFARQLFHHLAQQPVRAYGADQPEKLRQVFRKSDYNIRKLAVEIAVTAALTPRS